MTDSPGLFWLAAAVHLTPWWAWAAAAAAIVTSTVAIWRL